MDKVVHFEIPYDDKERVQGFYEKVFDWKFQDMPEMNYLTARSGEVDEDFMMKEKGVINGGMYKRDEKSAKSPVIVISVNSIDEKIVQIKNSGGKVFREKIQVGDMGFYAQVEDSEGNIIGIWEDVKKE